jgi:hypothetical protein
VFGLSALADAPFASFTGTVYGSSVTETGTATDVVQALRTLAASIAESASATDIIAGSPLWNPIDDSQNANWTQVPTGEIPTGMDSTFAGAAFGASPIAGLSWTYIPGVGWTLIPNNTTTNWQIIGTVN